MNYEDFEKALIKYKELTKGKIKPVTVDFNSNGDMFLSYDTD